MLGIDRDRHHRKEAGMDDSLIDKHLLKLGGLADWDKQILYLEMVIREAIIFSDANGLARFGERLYQACRSKSLSNESNLNLRLALFEEYMNRLAEFYDLQALEAVLMLLPLDPLADFGPETNPNPFDRQEKKVIFLTTMTAEEFKLHRQRVQERQRRNRFFALAELSRTGKALDDVMDTIDTYYRVPAPWYRDFIIGLIQDSVVGGCSFNADGHDYEKSALDFWSKLDPVEEPLAKLPLFRTELEGSLGPDVHCDGLEHPHDNEKAVRINYGSGKELPVREIKPVFNQHKIVAPVLDWMLFSNGRGEVRLFEVDGIQFERLGDLLLSLKLEALRGAASGEISCAHVPADLVFAYLFDCCQLGGAYSGGLNKAWSRLAAFESISALSGLPGFDNVHETIREAQECWWLTFTAKSDWYEGICWDMGVCAIRPDRKTVAVLAATDTD
jgi:hypothetical protein